MIKSGDLNEEIDDLKALAEEFKKDDRLYEAGVLKAMALSLKLLLNLRQNQTRIMEAQGVKLAVPKARNVSEETKK